MKRLPAFIFIWAAMLCLTFPLHAQEPSPTPSWEQQRERVHQLIMTRLTTGLNLDKTQAQQMEEILRKYKTQKMSLKSQSRKLTQRLREESERGDEKQIQKTLQELQATRTQLDRVNETMYEEVKPILSPQQQAQFVLIMDEIRHQVRAVRYRRHRPPNSSTPPPSLGLPSESGNLRKGYQ